MSAPLSAPLRTPLRLRYTAVSDVGRHRKDNQDSGYASDRLLVVADGVGGAAYGDVASATAVQLLRRLDDPAVTADSEELLTALAGAVHRVHDRLAELVEDDRELEGTSTTVTAALFDGSRLAVAHVGDSRAYLLRNGMLQRLTTDHTFVQSLVDEGRISEDEARSHPHRNIILRAVDGTSETEPDLFSLEVEPGDRVMLCSDGCSGVLSDQRLAALVGDGSIDTAALGLLQAALDADSTDNVTVVLGEVVAAGAEDDPETSAASSTGPMLVGAAAEQPRRGMLSRARGPRGRRPPTDTGELDPIPEPVADEQLDPEELRYAPREPHRRTRRRRLLLALAALLLLAGALGGAYAWSQQQYYVGVNGSQVAIYRGVELGLLGLDLSEVYETQTQLAVDDLPPFMQQSVAEGIAADGLTDARAIVDDLAASVANVEPEPAPGPTERPTPSPSPTRSPDPSPTRRST